METIKLGSRGESVKTLDSSFENHGSYHLNNTGLTHLTDSKIV